MDKNILLEELCITASTLSKVLYAKKKSQEKKDDRIYKKALTENAYSILRRLHDIEEEKPEGLANIMENGKICEALIQGSRYKDDRYLKQQAFTTKVKIGVATIPFRATLDVFDSKEGEIIELKACYWKQIDNNVPPLAEREAMGWTGSKFIVNQEDYANEYVPQVQVQYICAKELSPKKACVAIFSNEKLYISNNIPEDPNFIHNNKDAILEFWTEIVYRNNLYLSADKQTLIDLHPENKISETIFQDDIFMEDIAEYTEVALSYKQFAERKKELENTIIRKLEAVNIKKLPLPYLTVQKANGARRVNYSAFFKDKIGSLDALTEEERSMYCVESAPSWRFTLARSNL